MCRADPIAQARQCRSTVRPLPKQSAVTAAQPQLHNAAAAERHDAILVGAAAVRHTEQAVNVIGQQVGVDAQVSRPAGTIVRLVVVVQTIANGCTNT